MNLRLRVLNGPLKGRFTPIRSGTVIGRGPNRLGLRDPKISTEHAKVIQNQAGQLIIKDLGSRNGVKVDGRRVKQLILTPGARFQLGQTQLQVEAAASKKEAPALPIEEDVVAIEVPPPEWPEYFQEFVAETRKKVKDQPKELLPFPTMLRMKFLRGLQIDSVWNMGYGPRNVGRGSLDFPLYEDGVPDLAFRVRAEGPRIVLETPHSNLIRLNKKYVSTEELKDGDLISVGSSLIQVSIKEM